MGEYEDFIVATSLNIGIQGLFIIVFLVIIYFRVNYNPESKKMSSLKPKFSGSAIKKFFYDEKSPKRSVLNAFIVLVPMLFVLRIGEIPAMYLGCNFDLANSGVCTIFWRPLLQLLTFLLLSFIWTTYMKWKGLWKIGYFLAMGLLWVGLNAYNIQSTNLKNLWWIMAGTGGFFVLGIHIASAVISHFGDKEPAFTGFEKSEAGKSLQWKTKDKHRTQSFFNYGHLDEAGNANPTQSHILNAQNFRFTTFEFIINLVMGITFVTYIVPYIVGHAGFGITSVSSTAFIFFGLDTWLAIWLALALWTWNSRSEEEFAIINSKINGKIPKIQSVSAKKHIKKGKNPHRVDFLL